MSRFVEAFKKVRRQLAPPPQRIQGKRAGGPSADEWEQCEHGLDAELFACPVPTETQP